MHLESVDASRGRMTANPGIGKFLYFSQIFALHQAQVYLTQTVVVLENVRWRSTMRRDSLAQHSQK